MCSAGTASELLIHLYPHSHVGKWGLAPSVPTSASSEPLKTEPGEVRAVYHNYSCKVLGVINDTARRGAALCLITCRQALFR